MGFFKSFFSGKPENPEAEKQKNDQKNFEIFKYDGMRAQRMGRTDYAIKCFTEALKLQDDFETMSYLAQVYIQTNRLDEARRLLESCMLVQSHRLTKEKNYRPSALTQLTLDDLRGGIADLEAGFLALQDTDALTCGLGQTQPRREEEEEEA